MFHDLMALKLQVLHGGGGTQMLFHSHWPGADVVPENAAAETTDQVGSMYYYPSSESTVAWNYGANFAGPTKTDGSWTSGADSVTGAVTAQAANSVTGAAKQGVFGKGMFGKYLIADPSYTPADGGFGGDMDYYPLNGNSTVPMCSDRGTGEPCLG